MNSISVAVRFVCGRLSVQDLKWINEAADNSRIFFPIHPRGSVLVGATGRWSVWST